MMVGTPMGATDIQATMSPEVHAARVQVQASRSASAPAQLQNALKALGTMAGDPTLIKVKVDGIIGPATVKAANYAITTYGPFGQYFQKGNLHIGTVRSYAGGLAQVITQHIQQRGGTVPAAVIQAHRTHVSIPLPVAPEASEPESDRRWIFWAVGGAAVLLTLALAASAARKHRQPAAAAA